MTLTQDRTDTQLKTAILEELAWTAGVNDSPGCGTVDHGVVTGMLLGSVSTHSVHHAACPVVVVP